MSETQNTILGEVDPKTALRNQGLVLMLKGGLYGLIVFASVILFILVLKGVGALLPPESKEAPDPTPTSAQIQLLGETDSRIV